MNRWGQLAGGFQDMVFDIEAAFVTDRRGGFRSLTTTEDDVLADPAYAMAVNDRGQVLGRFDSVLLGATGAFLWDPRIGFRVMPELDQRAWAVPVALTESGKAIVNLPRERNDYEPTRAVLWNPFGRS
jgi:hypothetical protein